MFLHVIKVQIILINYIISLFFYFKDLLDECTDSIG